MSVNPQADAKTIEPGTGKTPLSAKKPARFFKKPKFYIILGAALVLVGAIVVLTSPGSRPATANTGGMSTVTVEKMTLQSEVLVSGTVKSKSSTNVYAPSAFEVKSINKDVGDKVKAGDVLATLDTESLERDIIQAELNIKNSENSLKNEKKSNSASKSSSANSVTTAKHNLEEAQYNYNKLLKENGGSAVRNAEIALQAAKRDYNNTTAPSTATNSAKLDYDAAVAKYNSALSNKSSSLASLSAAATSAYNAWQALIGTGTQAQIDAASEAYYKAEGNYRSQENSLNDAINTAYAAMEKARMTYENSSQNASDTLATKKEALEKAQMAYDDALANASESIRTAKNNLTSAELSYQSARDSLSLASAKDTMNSETSLEIMRMNLEDMQKQLAESTIVAPCDGTITYSNLTVGAGASGLIYVIEDIENLVITTAVGEYDIGAIKEGQKAIINFDATGDSDFAGVVSHLSPTAQKSTTGETTSTTNVQFDAEITVTEFDPRVKIGMNAQISIITKEKADVLAVPFDAVTTMGDKSFISVPDGETGSVKSIPIEKGMETDAYIEIISDQVHEGMQVVSSTAGLTLTGSGGFGGQGRSENVMIMPGGAMRTTTR